MNPIAENKTLKESAFKARAARFARVEPTAEYLDLSRWTIYKTMRVDPTFPRGAKVGGVRMFDLDAIDAWLAAKAAAQQAERGYGQ